jgi:hypothetical protein
VNLSSIDLAFSVRHANRDDQDFAEFAEHMRTTRFLDGSRMPVNVCLGLTLLAPARPLDAREREVQDWKKSVRRRFCVGE